MTYLLSLGLRPVDGINILILLLLMWILYRIISDDGNMIVWADFIASTGRDGKQHGDLNKIGQLAGICIAVMSVLMYSDNKTVDATGLSILLGVALLYLGGVSGYAASLRAKQGSVTTVTEPVPDPSISKTTTVQTPPIEAPKKGKK